MILPSKAPTASLSSSCTEVVRYSESPVPTSFGDVQLIVFRERGADVSVNPHKEHVAMVFGELTEENLLVRVHSECITSEVFGSLKCDCKLQLDAAMAAMQAEGQGALLYLRQEGRGIGLGNKIKAYALQSQGADTISANHQLGFETDLRTYDVAAGMLHDLGVKSVQLMTNNPDKVSGLEQYGIKVSRRVRHAPSAHVQAQDYLRVKQEQLGHDIDDSES